ncbi:MAG TPA: hypothetical protein DCM50_00480, partial [Stenotrophomonas sp.]|nr:hypothetical protein [Stenotrophomonas sp.]
MPWHCPRPPSPSHITESHDEPHQYREPEGTPGRSRFAPEVGGYRCRRRDQGRHRCGHRRTAH